jgi:hypothetical protein
MKLLVLWHDTATPTIVALKSSVRTAAAIWATFSKVSG